MPVTLAVLVTVGLRVPLIGAPVYRDEGGYLLVAHYWRTGGPYLYGSLFVDRPPLLLAIFRLADSLGGLDALRLIGLTFAVATVIFGGWAGWLIGGSRSASWGAFAAAALVSSPLMGVGEVDGELLAVPLVVLSCALTLAAIRTSPRSRVSPVGYALAAGLCAAAAAFVKQNFLDAGVFAVALLTTSALSGRQSRAAALKLLGCFVAGAAIPVAAAAVWAVGWATGVDGLWFAMYGIRWKALQVLHGQDLIPADRLHRLEISALRSGMVSLAAIFVISQHRALRRLDPLIVAVVAMLTFEVVGIALGGNFYLHYLIQLVPSVVLASACLGSARLAALSARGLLWARLGIGVVIVSAVQAAVSAAIPPPQPSSEMAAFEAWIHAAARPTDSLMITYGNADLFEASGLRPAYQHLWSLPMRVLDPRLTELSAALAGPRAPTWVVEWDPFDLLGEGPAATLQSTLSTHYRDVADICGHQIYQLDGTSRPLPATIGPC